MEIRFSRQARRYFSRLDVPTRQRIAAVIDQLRADPFHENSKPLVGLPGRRAIRVGGWRVVYLVHRDEGLIEVTDIAPRGEVHRGLR